MKLRFCASNPMCSLSATVYVCRSELALVKKLHALELARVRTQQIVEVRER